MRIPIKLELWQFGYVDERAKILYNSEALVLNQKL